MESDFFTTLFFSWSLTTFFFGEKSSLLVEGKGSNGGREEIEKGKCVRVRSCDSRHLLCGSLLQRQRKSKAGAGQEDVGEKKAEEEPVQKQARVDEQKHVAVTPARAQQEPKSEVNNGPQLQGLSSNAPQPQQEKAEPSFYQRTNPHKPSALPHLTSSHTPARKYTVSVALPGSIVFNAQTPELQARLAGQLARTCAIFNVDEIIVFDEGQDEQAIDTRRFPPRPAARKWKEDGQEEGTGEEGGPQGERKPFDANGFLARILQYVETPQYLRKQLFPMHRDLRLAGLIAPLDCPHHLRYEDESAYREGIVQDVTSSSAPSTAKGASTKTVYVYVGFRDALSCRVPSHVDVPVGARVTVQMPGPGVQYPRIVSPRTPVEQLGTFWGYQVRLARGGVSEVLNDCPWSSSAGYDLVIGTSERGSSLSALLEQTSAASATKGEQGIPPFDHALIMLGGLSGLEVAVERDAKIHLDADGASKLFDLWINVVEGQGSRTIRTEEALMITLARLKTALEATGRR